MVCRATGATTGAALRARISNGSLRGKHLSSTQGDSLTNDARNSVRATRALSGGHTVNNVRAGQRNAGGSAMNAYSALIPTIIVMRAGCCGLCSTSSTNIQRTRSALLWNINVSISCSWQASACYRATLLPDWWNTGGGAWERADAQTTPLFLPPPRYSRLHTLHFLRDLPASVRSLPSFAGSPYTSEEYLHLPSSNSNLTSTPSVWFGLFSFSGAGSCSGRFLADGAGDRHVCWIYLFYHTCLRYAENVGRHTLSPYRAARIAFRLCAPSLYLHASRSCTSRVRGS